MTWKNPGSDLPSKATFSDLLAGNFTWSSRANKTVFFSPRLFSIVSWCQNQFLPVVSLGCCPGGLFWGRDITNLYWPQATCSQGWPWIPVLAGLLQRSGILYTWAADTGHGEGMCGWPVGMLSLESERKVASKDMIFSGNFFKKTPKTTGFNLEFYFTIKYVKQFVFECSRSQKLMNKSKVYWSMCKHVTINFNNNSSRTKKCPAKLWDRVSCLTIHELSFSPKTAHKLCWGLKWTKCSDFGNSLKFSFWGLE